ncbi:helix-turn-helix domain-containing protein [Rhodospirillum sp. A1_3_36]|uniref:helix-turn-helix domain-containing protein n=1 Tax=Rhodospirillum sp. A1_3_36 TaxID=3391666 RepID=UPI0039A4B6E1
MENSTLSPKAGGGRDAAPTPVDISVGRRLRWLRRSRGLSTRELADHVGFSGAQLMKYELGTNRISASRLYGLACALGVTPSFFFEDLPSPTGEPIPEGAEMMTHPLTWEMLRAFEGIRSSAQKQAAYALLLSMAACFDAPIEKVMR